MGRIKTTAIKELARVLMDEYGNKFSADFEKNKKVLAEVKPMKSKRTRNIVAGYLAKKTRAEKSREK
jgi:small subunit ribosomal protein S17e